MVRVMKLWSGCGGVVSVVLVEVVSSGQHRHVSKLDHCHFLTLVFSDSNNLLKHNSSFSFKVGYTVHIVWFKLCS